MKRVRLKYIFLLLFTFLSLNLISISVKEIKAEESGLDLTNAYRGNIQNYWALVNYGEDILGKDEMTIFLDPDAINNPSVSYIQLNEFDNYGAIVTTYYQRGIDSSFASRFNYTLVTSDYGDKTITLYLLEDLSNKPTAIIERIDIDRLKKIRTIEYLNSADFALSKEVTEVTNSPYKVYIDIADSSKSCDYLIDSVVYSYYHYNPQDDTYTYVEGNAILDTSDPNTCNRYYFTVSENATYNITVEDHFGYVVPKEGDNLSIMIDNFSGNQLIIVPTYDNTPTRGNVEVMFDCYDELGHTYPIDFIEYVKYEFSGVESADIKNIGSFSARENGIYILRGRTTNGIETEIEVNITNIDRIAPNASATSVIYINSSDVESSPYVFDPNGYILATDNA